MQYVNWAACYFFKIHLYFPHLPKINEEAMFSCDEDKLVILAIKYSILLGWNQVCWSLNKLKQKYRIIIFKSAFRNNVI